MAAVWQVGPQAVIIIPDPAITSPIASAWSRANQRRGLTQARRCFCFDILYSKGDLTCGCISGGSGFGQLARAHRTCNMARLRERV